MDPYVGEIRLFGGQYAPVDWNFCDGSLLSVADYSTLFALIGTAYGGDGQNTFGLPDLRSRLPVGQGQGPGRSPYALGQMGGSEQVAVFATQMQPHSHPFVAQATAAQTDQATGAFLAQPQNGGLLYLDPTGVTPTDVVLAPDVIGIAGGNQPHENRMPSVAASYIISLFGIFPSRN